jgi:DMSO/TMAO reductase YedYZ heme-binding membrane subunit
MMTVVFLGLHVLTSVLDTYVNIGWLAVVVPFASPYSRFWVGLGTVALDLMIAVFVSSLLRARLRPGTWRGIHWLAYASWPIALAHTFGLGTDAGEQWVIATGTLCVLAVGLSFAWRLHAATRRTTVASPGPPQPVPLTRRVASSTGGRRDVP